jgi:hypothetical protein
VPNRDASAIAELLSELGYPTDGAGAAARLRISPEQVLVAEERGRAIALATIASLHMLTHAHPVCRLTALVVSSAHRRRGLHGSL